MDVVLQQVVSGLSLGSVYALVALGYSLVFSTLRVVNFAQGHLVMLSSLITVSLWVGRGWPLGAAVGIATVACAGVAFVLERAVTVPLRTSSPFVWIVMTLGAAIAIEVAAQHAFGTEPRPFPPLVAGSVRLGDAVVARDTLVVIAAALAIMLAIDRFLKRTIWGKAMQATAYSRWVPRLLGVPVSRIVTLSFVLSGAIAGLAGALVGPLFKATAPNLGLQLGLFGFIAVVVGGMGSTAGALVGGLLLGVAQFVLRGQLPPGIGTGAIFLLLIVLLVARPTGLFGRSWNGSFGGAEA